MDPKYPLSKNCNSPNLNLQIKFSLYTTHKNFCDFSSIKDQSIQQPLQHTKQPLRCFARVLLWYGDCKK